jgi:hypothetical protein
MIPDIRVTLFATCIAQHDRHRHASRRSVRTARRSGSGDGDTIEVEIDAVGVLRNLVRGA